MSKFSKLLQLIILLKSRKRLKTKELAELLGVSERMIRKYMNDLAEANIYVKSLTGPTGGYELIGYDYLTHLDLKPKEIVSLKVAINDLKKSDSYPFISDLESLSDKLTIAVDRTKQQGEQQVIASDNNELLLQAASITCNKVKLQYQSVTSGVTERIVHPYGLVSNKGFSYLIAYCENKEKILTFKLIRVRQLEVLNDLFEKDESVSIKDFTTNPLGVFNDEIVELTLHIRKPFAQSVSEQVYAANQKICYQEDGSIIFKGTMKGKTDIVRWILSMQSYVTIIEPQELKNELKEELTRMLDII